MFAKKIWADRNVEFPGRRKLTDTSTSMETTVDVTRAEGTISAEGDAFSAANMNDLEVRIEEGFSKTVYELSRQTLSIDTNGWVANAQGWYEKTVTCNYAVANSVTQRVDVAVQGTQIGNVLLAGLRVDADDTLTLVCLSKPSSQFELMVIISEVV